ncbi:hypothetical protein [Marinicella sp. W31]|uniref:hypothetical protein n=1 Tax=Marinicella sp. W31 TaxID=3023713 RepID=UPI0037568E39
MKSPLEISPSKLKSFWHYLPAFTAYLKQEKLYFLLLVLSLASLHKVFPIILITFIIDILLYLALYKIAFEVLRTTAAGEAYYEVSTHLHMSDYVGVKALLLPLLPLPLYILMYPSNPELSLVLTVIVLVIIPASYMLMSENGSLTEALNPQSIVIVIQRIGFEYFVLTLLYLLVTALPLLITYLLSDSLVNWVEYILFALIYNFSIVWVFHIMGFVLYRHAQELGFNQSVLPETELFPEDPIKDRIEQLLAAQQPEQALKTIEELQINEGRTDLAYLKSQAQEQILLKKNRSSDDRISELIEQDRLLDALKAIAKMQQQGQQFRPAAFETLAKIIQYAHAKQQFNLVAYLIKGLDRAYPQEHQSIVDHYYMLAKIRYEQGKTGKAITLLNRTIERYQKTAKVSALKSYLRGIHLKKH